MTKTGKKRLRKPKTKMPGVKKNKAPTVKKNVFSPSDPVSHHVPNGYNVDTIVVMPVNGETSFVYWEVTDKLLKGYKKKLKARTARILIKLFEAGTKREVCSFQIDDRVGKSYVNYTYSLNPLVAEIGVLNGNGFVSLLRSGSVSALPEGLLRDKAGHDVKNSREAIVPATASPVIPGMWMTRTLKGFDVANTPCASSNVSDKAILDYYLKAASSEKEHSSISMHSEFPE